MPRPPFRRQRPKQRKTGSAPGKPANSRAKRLAPVRNILVALLALSLFQYFTQGEVSWPRQIYQKITGTLGDYATRPAAGWRKAGKQLDDLGAQREGRPTPAFDVTGRVVGISDGDTLSILDSGNQQHTIRLFGIDTPEWDQPHGSAAEKALAEMVSKQSVGVVTIETDSFGRTVGTIYLGDKDINLAMIEGGHAWWFRKYAPYERHLEAAEQDARAARRGLWASPNPVPPWNWRRRN
jgi:endonuclease YncB( thermonuclease family)